jgi:hypothetical protein
VAANRRTVVVAPTLAEAEAEARELGIRRQDALLVANGCTSFLRGHAVTEDEVVRVREESWSPELRATLEHSLGAPG